MAAAVGWAWRTTHNWEAKSNTRWIELFPKVVSVLKNHTSNTPSDSVLGSISYDIIRMYLNDICMYTNTYIKVYLRIVFFTSYDSLGSTSKLGPRINFGGNVQVEQESHGELRSFQVDLIFFVMF